MRIAWDADHLGRGFEFASQIGRITPGTHQRDPLAPKLRRIGRRGLGHKGDTSRKSILGVHQTRATSFDVLDNRVVAQPGIAQAGGQALVAALGHLAIDQ